MIVRDLHRLLTELASVHPDARVMITTDAEHVADMVSIRLLETEGDEPLVLLTPMPVAEGV